MLRARQQLPDSQSSFFSEPAAGNFVQGGRWEGAGDAPCEGQCPGSEGSVLIAASNKH